MLEHIEKKIDKIEADIAKVKKLLIGNGTIGVAEMARRAFEFKENYTKSKNSWIDWAFRITILIMLSYVGLRK